MHLSPAAALRLAGLAVAATLTLAGCGDDPEDGTATDPGGSASPTPASTPSPTAEPTVGTYPHFGPQDYDYTLRVSCFCPDAGVPIAVTVREGDVTSAVYAESGRGVHAGDPVEEYRWVTIDDIIDAANDTEAARVDVRWPEGQDYPSSVFVDQDEQMMDEEIGYQVSGVSVALTD